MATIENNYTGNNTTTLYSFTFPYLETSDIKVSLDNVITTAYTIPTPTQISFNSAPGTGVAIRIYRDTDIDSLRAEFFSGSAIRAQDLNEDFNQTLYNTQETEDAVAKKMSTTGTSTMTGNLNMGTGTAIVLEGATANAHETTLTVTDPTADRTITLPDVTGTVITTGSTGAVATAMIADDAVTGAKIADDAIDSEHYTDGSIDTAHIADSQVTSAKIADGTIVAGDLASDAVTAAKIADDAVTTAKIANGAVATAKIADDGVTAAKMADNAVVESVIAAQAVTTTRIANDAIGSGQIADDAIDSEHITDGAIDLAHMSANSVDSDQYVDGSIDTAHIANGQVATATIADDAVTSAKIADNAVVTSCINAQAVTTTRIANDAIGSGQIADDAIDSEHYTDGSIDTAHIGDGQVTTAKIADDGVTAAKIADNAVVTSCINAQAVTTSRIANDAIGSGQVADNAIDSEHYVDGSIDHVHLAADIIDGDNIQDDVINSEHIAAGAVDLEHMSANSVDSDQYVDGSIDHVHLAADAVDGDNIADDSIDSEHYTDGSIDTAHLADDAVTSAKIADDAITSALIADDAITSALIADDAITSALIADDAITSALIADDAVVQAAIADEAVNEVRLQISNAGSNGQYLQKQSGNTGGLTWASPGGGTASAITIADESSDTTCFPLFSTDATGDIAPKSDSQLTYNSSSGALGATTFVGNVDAVDGDFDGTLEADAITVDGTALNEYIADTVGGMVTGNTETGITVTYEDGDNTLDFVLAADSVSGANIADDAIDSEHYTDGSIDTAHIADNQITLAKMAGGTDGQIITYDASGDPVAVGPGTDGQVLTSTGAGSPPAFEDPSSGGVKNLIINGAMQVNQRGTVTGVSSNSYGGPDRWKAFRADVPGIWQLSQVADGPAGFSHCLEHKVTTANSTLDAGDEACITYSFEGQDLTQVKKGTASAEQLTLSFWCKSSTTGTYIVELYDTDNNRQCSQSFTISSATTWEQKELTFPADTTGAFTYDNNESLAVRIWYAAGTTWTSGTLSTTWTSATDANRAVGCANLSATLNNYFRLTGVQLEIGATATDFEHRSYGDELARCQRYHEAIYMNAGTNGFQSATSYGGQVSNNIFAVTKRAQPTFSLEGNAAWVGTTPNVFTDPHNFIFHHGSTAYALSDADQDLCGSFSCEL